jgi:hypothetical protein
LRATAGANRAAAAAWNEEQPPKRWHDILILRKRLAPEKQLVPDDPAVRNRAVYLSQETCE